MSSNRSPMRLGALDGVGGSDPGPCAGLSPAHCGAVAAHSSDDISPLFTQKMSLSHRNSGASSTSSGHGAPLTVDSFPSGHIHGSISTTLVILGSICASIRHAAPPNECPTAATRVRSTFLCSGLSGSPLASTILSSACARSSARHRACSCLNRHQFLGSDSIGMSYPRKSAVDPSGYSTSAASWG